MTKELWVTKVTKVIEDFKGILAQVDKETKEQLAQVDKALQGNKAIKVLMVHKVIREI